MATPTQPLPALPRKYLEGLAPDWVDRDSGLLELLEHAHRTDPHDVAPLLVVCDYLADREDPREGWVRACCQLQQEISAASPAKNTYPPSGLSAHLEELCGVFAGWKMCCAWISLLTWYFPMGDGKPTSIRWMDDRALAITRLVWWWSLGFLSQETWKQAHAILRKSGDLWWDFNRYARWNKVTRGLADATWYRTQLIIEPTKLYWRGATIVSDLTYSAQTHFDQLRQKPYLFKDWNLRSVQVWGFAWQTLNLCYAKLKTGIQPGHEESPSRSGGIP